MPGSGCPNRVHVLTLVVVAPTRKRHEYHWDPTARACARKTSTCCTACGGSHRDPRYRELHHYHVLNVALQEMDKRMHDEGNREEVMKDLEDEMCRPCGPTLPDEGSQPN